MQQENGKKPEIKCVPPESPCYLHLASDGLVAKKNPAGAGEGVAKMTSNRAAAVEFAKSADGFDRYQEVFSDMASQCMLEPFERGDDDSAAIVLVEALLELPQATIDKLLSFRSKA